MAFHLLSSRGSINRTEITRSVTSIYYIIHSLGGIRLAGWLEREREMERGIERVCVCLYCMYYYMWPHVCPLCPCEDKRHSDTLTLSERCYDPNSGSSINVSPCIIYPLTLVFCITALKSHVPIWIDHNIITLWGHDKTSPFSHKCRGTSYFVHL